VFGVSGAVKIFLSYRRDDAAGHAGRLNDALTTRFGADAVFQDVATIQPGEDFEGALTAAIEVSDVVLVVIGPSWGAARGAGAKGRLHDPDDYVRFEVSTALARNKRVIPVTVAGASLPEPSDLPEGLETLITRQSVDLRDTAWGADVETLIRSLVNDRSTRRTKGVGRRVLLAAVALSLVVVAVWRPWSDTVGSNSDSDSLQECNQPINNDPKWTSLNLAPSPSANSEDMHFEARQVGYQELENGSWNLLVSMSMTNNTSTGEYHASWRYDGIVVDSVLEPLSCFSTTGGGFVVPEGLRGDALIGIELDQEPQGQIQVALEDARFVVSNPG
jgi:hypothetical protein